MTPEEFVSLPAKSKAHIVLTHGSELIDRIFMFYVIKLYMLDSFYVEIWYHQISNKIDKVQLVDIDDVVHLYEKRINISDLFS